MIIYKITNLINGKIYIGKDKYDNPNYMGSGKLIKLAINKYGKNNFRKEIIEKCNSENELNIREKYWIKKLNSCKYGYNIAMGGEGGDTTTNHPNRKEIIRKRSMKIIGRPSKLKGRTISEKTKNKIKKNNSKYWKNKSMHVNAKNGLNKHRKTQNMWYKCKVYQCISPEGKRYLIANTTLEKFCNYFNLQRSKMISVSSGDRIHHKGWGCSILNNYKDPVISLLDNDFYKFTQQQAVFHNFVNEVVEYEFKCRNASINLSKYKKEIEFYIDKLCSLKFSNEELEYLRDIEFIKDDYIQYLKNFKFKRENIILKIENGNLNIKIQGKWVETILLEVPILSIVNQIYFKDISGNKNKTIGFDFLIENLELIKKYKNFKFVDFGTRRRFSRGWQEQVVSFLKNEAPNNLIGTSNVYLAKKYKLKPIGTQSHEWFMAMQVLSPKFINFQKFALQTWADEYRGDLGIALSDVVGMDAFLRDFDKYFCKLFDGARHDSGDPYEWGDKLINHYKEMGIDPKTKQAVWSDGLTISNAIAIWFNFKNKINCSFGIGTFLTNNLGFMPLQIVIKMTRCNGNPVAKISDSPGKQMCKDQSYLSYLKKVFLIGEGKLCL